VREFLDKHKLPVSDDNVNALHGELQKKIPARLAKVKDLPTQI
jgi:hypothetical protein